MYKEIVEFISVLLIPVFLGYITYLQWWTSERQRRQDLFDKRFTFYKNLQNLLRKIQINSIISVDAKKNNVELFNAENFLGNWLELYDLIDECEILFGYKLKEKIYSLANICKFFTENLPTQKDKDFDKIKNLREKEMNIITEISDILKSFLCVEKYKKKNNIENPFSSIYLKYKSNNDFSKDIKMKNSTT